MKLIPKTPKLVKLIFPSYVWDIKTNNKTLFLTFDDGPTPNVTEWVLDILAKYNAKATFFCVGKNVEKYPELYKRIVHEGHSVGNHTYSHIKGWKVSVEDYIYNIERAANFINSKLFRPPYGEITIPKAKALKKLGYKIIMWDVVAIDWNPTISTKKTASNVLKNTASGSIVVFHDSIKAEKNMKFALSETLKHFSEKGYEFRNVAF